MPSTVEVRAIAAACQDRRARPIERFEMPTKQINPLAQSLVLAVSWAGNARMSSFAVVIAEVKATVKNLPFPLNPADCGDGNPVNTEPIVFVVDDDASMREALSNLIRSVGLLVQTFPTAQAFLDCERPDAPACLVLDVRLPGKSGLDLQRELARGDGDPVPIVFITAHGDIPMSVRAMKAGAVEFLPKPFRDQDLLDAIAQALDRDRRARHERTALANIQHCYQQLTPRECAIATLIVEGLRNKQVAARLGVSEVTVKVHRRKVLEKMGVRSLPQLSLLLKRIETH